MKSKDKMEVTAKPFGKYGKHWVKVTLHSVEWVPSFEDLFRIIHAICYCEDLKYPNGQGRFMVRDFLKDCCELLRPGETLEARWKTLYEKYKLKR